MVTLIGTKNKRCRLCGFGSKVQGFDEEEGAGGEEEPTLGKRKD